MLGPEKILFIEKFFVLSLDKHHYEWMTIIEKVAY